MKKTQIWKNYIYKINLNTAPVLDKNLLKKAVNDFWLSELSQMQNKEANHILFIFILFFFCIL